MNRILLIGGSMLLLYSCVETTENENSEIPTEEMKSRVEAEEIEFEKNETIEVEDSTNRVTAQKSVDPGIGTCVIPKGEFREDLLTPPPPPPIICRGPVPDPNAEIFEIPEIDAQFPGGIEEFKKFISENLSYPDVIGCYQGRVYVSFIVEKDGCITHTKVMRGVSEELDSEALRVIRSMPKWIPAQNNGKVVAARVRLPISFTLN